jgi:hypothetical protein
MDNELTLEQWQQYLLNARNALHDPNATPELRHEAAAAIEQATAVLNNPDKQAMAAGENVGESGFGKLVPALKGLGESALDIPVGMWKTAVSLLSNPGKTIANIPKALLYDLPKSIFQGIVSGDPERIARAVGTAGSIALPWAKASGLVRIPGLASAATAAKIAEAPSIGSLIGRAVTAVPRAGMELLNRPATANMLSKARTAAAATRASNLAELSPERLMQAKLRTQIMEQQLSKLKGGPGTSPAGTMEEALARWKAPEGSGTTPPVELPAEIPPAFPGENLNPTATLGESANGALRQALEVTGPRAPRPAGQGNPFDLEGTQDAMRRLDAVKAHMERQTPESILGTDVTTEIGPPSQTPFSDLIENQQGKMGQKGVQFGKGSPLSPESQAEILQLLGQLSNILGKKGSM